MAENFLTLINTHTHKAQNSLSSINSETCTQTYHNQSKAKDTKRILKAV